MVRCTWTGAQHSRSEIRLSFPQAIAIPAGVGRDVAALACLQILPSERGHYYYQLIKHYHWRGNNSALGKIQQALTQDTRWEAFHQIPRAPWRVFCLPFCSDTSLFLANSGSIRLCINCSLCCCVQMHRLVLYKLARICCAVSDAAGNRMEDVANIAKSLRSTCSNTWTLLKDMCCIALMPQYALLSDHPKRSGCVCSRCLPGYHELVADQAVLCCSGSCSYVFMV